MEAQVKLRFYNTMTPQIIETYSQKHSPLKKKKKQLKTFLKFVVLPEEKLLKAFLI